MTIAVTSATGQLGRLVIESLRTEIPEGSLIALARSPDKAGDLGVEMRAFDYDQADLLAPALEGAETLLLISSNDLPNRVQQHANVIAAARQAGVDRIVYISLLHADTSSLDLAAQHLATEAELAASGLSTTILRNGWYTENYTDLVPAALERGAFLGCAGNGLIAAAPRADYAEAAAAVLTSGGHDGKVYELAGDSAWTLSDLAAEISHQTHRDIPYQDLPQAEYVAALKAMGLPGALAEAIAGWDVAAAHGALFHHGHQLSNLIGRHTAPLADAVRAARA